MSEKNWKDLCEEIVAENDSKKLLSLVSQLSDALENRKGDLQKEMKDEPKEKIA